SATLHAGGWRAAGETLPRSAGRRPGALEVAERRQQCGDLRPAFELVDAARQPQRRLHLLEVRGAPRAELDVVLEAHAHVVRQPSLEVVGHQLDELTARDLQPGPRHAGTAAASK